MIARLASSNLPWRNGDSRRRFHPHDKSSDAAVILYINVPYEIGGGAPKTPRPGLEIISSFLPDEKMEHYYKLRLGTTHREKPSRIKIKNREFRTPSSKTFQKRPMTVSWRTNWRGRRLSCGTTKGGNSHFPSLDFDFNNLYLDLVRKSIFNHNVKGKSCQKEKGGVAKGFSSALSPARSQSGYRLLLLRRAQGIANDLKQRANNLKDDAANT